MSQSSKSESVVTARICKPAPGFECNALMPDTSFQKIKLSQYRGSWLLLFFYPLDFTFVCPTEIIEFSDRSGEFEKLGCYVLGASVDSQYSHYAWVNVPRNKGGLGQMQIPLLSDMTRKLSESYGVLLDDVGHACRGTFLIDPKGVIRHMQMNEPSVGRNVEELLRLLQAFQFADENGEVCPAKWKPGQPTIKPDPKESLEYFEKTGEKH